MKWRNKKTMNRQQTNIVLSHFIGQTRQMAKGINDRLELLKDPYYEPISDAIDRAIRELDSALDTIDSLIKNSQNDGDTNYASFKDFIKGL